MSTTELQTFELKVWTRFNHPHGPRNQTNCMNGWGWRMMTVEAKDFRDALIKLEKILGPRFTDCGSRWTVGD